MKIFAHDGGDSSVGISGCTYVLELPQEKLDDEERKQLRAGFGRFIIDYFDCEHTLAGVWFSDECPDCYRKLKNDKCVNESCISYGH